MSEPTEEQRRELHAAMERIETFENAIERAQRAAATGLPPCGIPDSALQPAPLTERDVQRVVLDVLERIALRYKNELEYRAVIAAVRRELKL